MLIQHVSVAHIEDISWHSCLQLVHVTNRYIDIEPGE